MLAIVPRTRVGGAFCAEAVAAASKPIAAKAAPIVLTLDGAIAPAPRQMLPLCRR
jgi:hypothetical protein